jgi:hypothetical protein
VDSNQASYAVENDYTPAATVLSIPLLLSML